MKKTLLLILVILGLGGITMTTSAQQSLPEEWDVPQEYKTLKNPFDMDNEVLSNGKMLYNMHCRLCHGKKGLGDGPGGRDLETKVPDLNSEAIQSQSEGVLFYKIAIGRKDMPEYKNKIPEDEDRWNLVSYLKETFGN